MKISKVAADTASKLTGPNDGVTYCLFISLMIATLLLSGESNVFTTVSSWHSQQEVIPGITKGPQTAISST